MGLLQNGRYTYFLGVILSFLVINGLCFFFMGPEDVSGPCNRCSEGGGGEMGICRVWGLADV